MYMQKIQVWAQQVSVVCSLVVLVMVSTHTHADPGGRVEIKHVKTPYMEYSQPKDVMSREFRMFKEGMSGIWHSYKAQLNAYVHSNTPGVKRYKFVNYLHNDEDIIPLQYIDWTKEGPVLTNKSLDIYVSEKLSLFCLQPQDGIELYMFDGRFHTGPDGVLRSVANHLPIMGEDGIITLTTNKPVIDEKGRIFENEVYVDTLKIVSFKNPDGLWTVDGSVFYIREPQKIVYKENPDYKVLQGYYEAQNVQTGVMPMRLITPYGEATATAVKKYVETYELMFQALND